MRKLTMKDAVKFHTRAKVMNRNQPDYRYGQALYNILPKDITVEINGTDDDFFYWTDNIKVTKHFFENFVEY